MPSLRQVLAATLVSTFATQFQVAQSQEKSDRGDTPTIGEIREAIDLDSFVLPSVHGEYTLTTSVPPGRPRRGVSIGDWKHSFAYSDGRFRWSKEYDGWTETAVYNGENSILLQSEDGEPFFASLHFGEHRRLSNPTSELRHLGVCPGQPVGRSTLFPFCLDLPEPRAIEGEYEVVGMAKIEGHDCIVLEWPTMDKIWIDPALGYRVRRREGYGGPANPVLTRVTTYGDFDSIGEDLWLPTKCRIEEYVHGELARNATIEFHSINAVDNLDDMFVVPLNEGTKIKLWTVPSRPQFETTESIDDAFDLLDEIDKADK